MKIVIVLDFYKESLFVSEVVQVIEKGFWEIFFDVQYVFVLVVDGGEGMVEVMIVVIQGVECYVWVIGLLGEKVNVSWGIFGDGKIVFIEMVVVSGLELVFVEKCDLFVIILCGIGELILQVLESGVINIIIGIGGSVINDGGVGMVQVLGVKLCDVNGNEIGFGGGSFNILNDIDIFGFDLCLKDCVICVVCDVINLLVGDNGVLCIFGL